MSKIYDKLKDIEKDVSGEENLEHIEIVTGVKEAKPKASFFKLFVIFLVFAAAVALGISLAKYYVSKDLRLESKPAESLSPVVSAKPQPQPQPVVQPKPQPQPVISATPYVYRGSKGYAQKLLEGYKKTPNNAVILNNLAVAYAEEGNFEEALRFAERALLSDPNNAFYWNSMGVALTNLNLYADAEKCFKKAVQISPNEGVFYYNLGNLYERSGNITVARENYLSYLAKSDKINPKNLETVKERLAKGVR